MGVFDTAFRLMARNLLALGATCSVSLITRDFDPLTDADVSPDPTTATMNCSPPMPFSHERIGTGILASDLALYVAAESFETAEITVPLPVNTNLQVTIDSRVYQVITVNEVRVEAAILYELQLRA